MLYSTLGIYCVCNNAYMCFVNGMCFNWETLIKTILKLYDLILHLPCWFLVVNSWSFFGLPCTIQSTLCEHCVTVKKIVFCNSQWKVSKWVSVKINNGDTLTLIDSDILNKNDVLWPPKKYVLINNKTVHLIWSIFYTKK